MALLRSPRLLGALAACSLLVGASAAPALADPGHTVTQTTHQHGTWTEYGDQDFCTGESIDPTITGNSVMHVTYFTGGDEVWGTFTTEGTATFLQPSSQLTFSGRVTVWGNFNVNERNANSTFTATFKASAVDAAGVTHYETGHETFHVGYNAADPSTPIVTVDKMNLTCS